MLDSARSQIDEVAAPRRAGTPPEPVTRTVRVAFVVHSMGVAGAEVLVREIIHRSRGAIEPTVLCLDTVGELGERLLASGVPVVCLGRRPGLDWRLPRRLARQLRRRRIEVVHAHQYTPFFYSALARALGAWRARLILTEHGRHHPDVVSTRRRWTNRLLLSRLVDRVTACSGFSRSALIELDGFAASRVEVVANGIEVERYGRRSDGPALRRGLGLEAGKRYVAAVGRLHPVKDHATLLHAFAELCRRRDDTDLLIVGDGPLRADLEALAGTLGIAKRVLFLGLRRDVAGILGAVDLFAQLSLSEAASLTLLEAMASSLPMVVTAVGGNPEIARQGREACLVPRGDWLAAATAMEDLLADPARAAKMGRAGRRRVKDHYRLRTVVARYLDLYRQSARHGGSR